MEARKLRFSDVFEIEVLKYVLYVCMYKPTYLHVAAMIADFVGAASFTSSTLRSL